MLTITLTELSILRQHLPGNAFKTPLRIQVLLTTRQDLIHGLTIPKDIRVEPIVTFHTEVKQVHLHTVLLRDLLTGQDPIFLSQGMTFIAPQTLVDAFEFRAVSDLRLHAFPSLQKVIIFALGATEIP
jgi:hypothetical protein